MKYQIIETERPSPWWQWIPPLTLIGILRFPYMVYATETEYPWGSILKCCATKWGARKVIRKELKREARLSSPSHEYVVVHEVRS